jgi:subtilase family serine protease
MRVRSVLQTIQEAVSVFQRLPKAYIRSYAAFFVLVVPFALGAQTLRRAVIREAIDETRLHRLAGNTRPEVRSAADAGAVGETLAMDHMLLQLQRSPEQERAAETYVQQLHDPKSPNFHKWINAAQYAQSFGLAQQDIDTVTAWLRSRGFTVNAVYPNGLTIDFSGTAGQVARAFHTSIHYLDAGGRRHVANVSDPEIPAALVPAVAGILSLHDFAPRVMRKAHPAFTSGTGNSAMWVMTPSDLATIYNLNPVFAAGITGKGQTIAVIEDADAYSADDYKTFRSAFGLDQYTSGSLVTLHPAPGVNGSACTDPGTRSGDDGEATLDVEWASAAAPDATVALASCASTRSTWGGLIALANLINSAAPPTVISISYGECEALNGAALNAAFRTLYQQAAAQGISIFVAAGDEGAAGCDAGASGATHGIGVSGWASTPYNVAVGGTDFGDTYAGTNSTYWSQTNDSNSGSALSYIPEIPWNDSCASTLLATALGYSSGYGSNGLCVSADARRYGLLQVAAGSGGPSGCATGAPFSSGIVGGTCQGYAKPDWQSGVAGNPADGVRDIPDVSLFAGTGLWGHYYAFCYTNASNGGAPCTGDPSTWAGAGGTSFGSPILAGIQALINQKTGSAQGNPNPVYYSLASGSALCDSTAGDNASSACIFHNVTLGDIDVNCGGSQNCFGDVGGIGVGRRAQPQMTGALSLSNDSFSPAFGTGQGWNFATGLGSINVANLVNNWPK